MKMTPFSPLSYTEAIENISLNLKGAFFKMATLGNQTFLDLELCEAAVTVPSNPVNVDIIDLQITKSASCGMAVVGGEICYTVTIINNSDIDFTEEGAGTITFRDPLDSHVTLDETSFMVSNDPEAEPVMVGNEITYELSIGAGETVTINFCVTVDSAPEPETEPQP